jgi:hypothetical protein
MRTGSDAIAPEGEDFFVIPVSADTGLAEPGNADERDFFLSN